MARCDEGRLDVVYNAEPNGEHVPYWLPVCGCGWRGEARYFRGYAMNQLREHHEASGAGAAADPVDQPPRVRVGERGGRTAA